MRECTIHSFKLSFAPSIEQTKISSWKDAFFELRRQLSTILFSIPGGSQSCMGQQVILNSPHCDPFSIIFHWLPREKQTITNFTTPSWSRALRKCKDRTGEPITAKGSADGTDSNNKAWPFATADLEFQEWSIINATSDMWPSQDAQEHLQDCRILGLSWMEVVLTSWELDLFHLYLTKSFKCSDCIRPFSCPKVSGIPGCALRLAELANLVWHHRQIAFLR